MTHPPIEGETGNVIQLATCERCGGPARSARARFCVDCYGLHDLECQRCGDPFVGRIASRQCDACRLTCIACGEKPVAKANTRCFDCRHPMPPSLPGRPLAEAILRQARREEHETQFAALNGIGRMNTVCKRVGISERNVRRWMSGTQDGVTFDRADYILIQLGLLWFDVWTDDDPEGHAIARWAFEGVVPDFVRNAA